MENLRDKKCSPCEGGGEPLTREEIKPYLEHVNGWMAVDSKKIEREFVFQNFAQALEFVNAVGGIAESEGHHPDILLHDYKKVKISLWTHAIGGLSENDFIVAGKIDGIARDRR
jgi:4a-hydroxytetrahydrobiopterin dehydratase